MESYSLEIIRDGLLRIQCKDLCSPAIPVSLDAHHLYPRNSSRDKEETEAHRR